jgi:hypothetical protein
MATVTPDPFSTVPSLPTPSYTLPTGEATTVLAQTAVPVAAEDGAKRRRRRKARRHIPIGSTVLFLTLLAGVVAQVGERLDWWRIDASDAVLVGLLAITAGFVISKVVNRSWVLIPVVVACAAATVLYAVSEPNLEGAVGLRTISPAAVAELDAQENLAIGALTIDLRDLATDGTSVTLASEVGVGELKVLLPPDVGLELTGSVNTGRMSLFGETVGLGTGIDQKVIVAPANSAAGTIVLDLHVGGGELEIHRMP